MSFIYGFSGISNMLGKCFRYIKAKFIIDYYAGI